MLPENEGEITLGLGANQLTSCGINLSDDSTIYLEETKDESYSNNSSSTISETIDDVVKQQKNDNKNDNETSLERDNVSSEENMKLPLITEELESHLTCPICQSLFHVPVLITPCHHTFCSECIRISMRTSRANTRKCICPLCRVITNEKNIIPCPTLEHIVRLYKQGIKDVLLEKELKIDPTRSHFASEEVPKLQRKAPVFYHAIKRKLLVQMLSSENLPTSGSDKELKDRHLRYTTLYNSECDASHPRTPAQILREVMSRERAVKSAQKGISEDSIGLEKLKNGSENNQVFQEKLNVNFDRLINNRKKGDSFKNYSVPSCIQDERQKLQGEKKSKIQVSVTTRSNKSNSFPIPTRNATPAASPPVTKNNNRQYPPIRQFPLPIVPPIDGPWYCPNCTVENNTRVWTNANCEECDNKRPESVTKRRRIEVVEID